MTIDDRVARLHRRAYSGAQTWPLLVGRSEAAHERMRSLISSRWPARRSYIPSSTARPRRA